jgi:outer membrane protein OmpA-like peptidoglycan-associated protein
MEVKYHRIGDKIMEQGSTTLTWSSSNADAAQSLSELRVQRVKEVLVSQGIAVEKIDTSAYGEQKPLGKTTVSDLQTHNPNQPPEKRARDSRAT